MKTFSRGDRVQLSELGIERLGNGSAYLVPYDEKMRGTVISQKNEGRCITVHIDGRKSASAFHHSFWKLAHP